MPRVDSSKPYSTRYIGIDPGASGGLAEISFDANQGKKIISATAMPSTEHDVWHWFKELDEGTRSFGDEIMAVIEWIHPAIQGIGKSSMSKLYGNYKQLTGFLIAADVPFWVIKAHEWQKALGIPKRTTSENTTKWKNRLKTKAQQLYPNADVTLSTCDALLIATYCKRKHEGKL